MKNQFVSFALVAVLLLVTVSVVSAQPSAQPVNKPEVFKGNVTVNGAAAPDGVLVSAKVSGADVSGTLTSGGNYELLIELKDTDEGKTIEFYVQNVKTEQSAVFDTGKVVNNFNLVATIPTTSPSTGGGGGGGSSGGGGLVPSGPATCTEDWICTDWTECSNSVQKRVCADVNRCNTTKSKPTEKQDCVMPTVCTAGETKCDGSNVFTCTGSGTAWLQSAVCENGCANGACIEKPAQTGFPFYNTFTGFFVAGSGFWMLGVATVIIVALVALYFVKFKGKGSKNPASKQASKQ